VCGCKEAVLVVDGRYDRAARRAVSDGSVAEVGVSLADGPFAEALGPNVSRMGTRIGYEAETVTVATLAAWEAATPGFEWVRTDRVVEELRVVKDAVEQAILRRAGRLLSDVASSLATFVRAGRSEIEIARLIDQSIEGVGFSGPAFPTIVASGPHSADPHARPSERRLAAGDLVVLDFGGVLGGYCVDLTRMAAVGPPGAEAVRLFDAVREAQMAALQTVRAGVTSSAVDEAARHALERRGLAEAFVHATGHGLGLDVHEAPRIGRSRASEPPVVLAEGMVCTIEPGAYVEGTGGVRLEDDVLVTVGGCEILTTAPADLMVV